MFKDYINWSLLVRIIIYEVFIYGINRYLECIRCIYKIKYEFIFEKLILVFRIMLI